MQRVANAWAVLLIARKYGCFDRHGLNQICDSGTYDIIHGICNVSQNNEHCNQQQYTTLAVVT